MCEIRKIITHPGKFHLDEVCAVAMIQLAFGSTRIPIIRKMGVDLTDEDVEDAWVLDTGNKYGYESHTNTEWFDHHHTKHGIKEEGQYRATAGLVWLRIGHAVVGNAVEKFELEDVVDEKDYILIADYVYNEHISKIDKHDLGKTQKEAPNMLSLISVFNQLRLYNGEKAFHKAVDMLRAWLQSVILRYIDNRHAESLVGAAFEDAISKNQNFLVLEKSCAFNTKLQELDPLSLDRKIHFVIFPADPEKGGGWGVLSRPTSNRNKQPLFPLASSDVAVFVHESRFYAVFEEKVDAIEYVKYNCVSGPVNLTA